MRCSLYRVWFQHAGVQLFHSVLIRTVVPGDDYCNPDVDKEWTDLELQTWDGMNKNEFYLFPDYAQNAVLRIKKFGNNRCSKNEVRIFPTEDSTGKTPNWVCCERKTRKFLFFSFNFLNQQIPNESYKITNYRLPSMRSILMKS